MRLLAILLFAATAFAQAPQQQPADIHPPDTKAPAPVKKAPETLKKEDGGARRARELMDKMIAALGGQAFLGYNSMETSGRVYSFRHGEPVGAGAPFWRFWQWPDRERIEITKDRDWYFLYVGDQGWEVTFRGPFPVEPKDLQDYLRRRHHSLENVTRVWMKQPDTAYFYEGRTSAGRRPVHQVTVMNANAEAVTFYLDVNTFLPVQKSFTWRDPETRERDEEVELYDNYRPFNGIMTAQATTRSRNGENVNQRFLTAVTYNTPLAATLFDPKASAEKRK